jgi:hypothetical protein
LLFPLFVFVAGFFSAGSSCGFGSIFAPQVAQ